VLVGPAGSGKSRALGAARAAWQAAGVQVRGVAPSAVAAGVLSEQAAIPSETLAKFLWDVRRGRTSLQRGGVVVCDEASMVATRDLAQLVLHSHQVGAKLVLVGDHHQLDAVEAGGLFKLLVTDATSAKLTSVRRFSDPWEAQATARLRERDPSVLAEYQHRDRVRSGDRESMVDSAHQAWMDGRAKGRSVVVMAADHDTVDQLALRARAARVAAGQVEPDGITVANQIVGVGDEVVTTLNDRRLVTTTGGWVRNGDRWRVLARSHDNSLQLASLDGRGKVTLPGHYTDENIALAYAVTIHKSQGVTVDQAVMVVDRSTSAEHLYVGMSRGRHQNLACVVCEAQTDEHQHSSPPGPHDVLAGVLRRSGNEMSATETLRTALDQTADVATLQAALSEAGRQIDAIAGPDRTDEIRLLRTKDARDSGLDAKLSFAREQLAQLTLDHEQATAQFVQAEQDLQSVQQKRRLFHGPDRDAIGAGEIAKQRAALRLRAVNEQINRAETAVSHLRAEETQATQTLRLLEGAETGQQQRKAWLAAHPEVVEHVNRLVSELRHTIRRERELRRFATGQTAIREPALGHQAGHEHPLVLEAPGCGPEL
jgi:hypothetical protein